MPTAGTNGLGVIVCWNSLKKISASNRHWRRISYWTKLLSQDGQHSISQKALMVCFTLFLSCTEIDERQSFIKAKLVCFRWQYNCSLLFQQSNIVEPRCYSYSAQCLTKNKGIYFKYACTFLWFLILRSILCFFVHLLD